MHAGDVTFLPPSGGQSITQKHVTAQGWKYGLLNTVRGDVVVPKDTDSTSVQSVFVFGCVEVWNHDSKTSFHCLVLTHQVSEVNFLTRFPASDSTFKGIGVPLPVFFFTLCYLWYWLQAWIVFFPYTFINRCQSPAALIQKVAGSIIRSRNVCLFIGSIRRKEEDKNWFYKSGQAVVSERRPVTFWKF